MDILIAFLGFSGSIIAVIIAFFLNKKNLANELKSTHNEIKEKNLEIEHQLVVQQTNIASTVQEDLFIGRDSMLDKILNEFKSSSRLVSIVGAGGLGKTRLAQEFGLKYQSLFEQGIWFVDLEEAKSKVGIAYAIQRDVFNLNLSSSQIDSIESTTRLLRKKGNSLIILDNFEQIINLGKDTIHEWLNSLPNISFLITSRFPLKLREEKVLELEPIEQPIDSNIDNLKQSPSIQLFIDRAKRYKNDFNLNQENSELLYKICKASDGIPLSIELCAARINSLSLREIAKSKTKIHFKSPYTDDSPRHSTVYDTINWSYDLLSDEEKIAFLQMSIFKDGFDLDAANSIIKIESKIQIEILDIIEKLLDHNLIKSIDAHDRRRFDMLVPIKDFVDYTVLVKFPEKEYSQLQIRWAEYYIDYAAVLNKQMHASGGKKALDLLGEEMENLFEIQEAFLEKDAVIACKAILAFAEAMGIRGPAEHRIPKLLCSYVKNDALSSGLSIKLCTEISKSYWSSGEWIEAEVFALKSVEISKSSIDQILRGEALFQLGKIKADRGFYSYAIDILSEAISFFRTEELNTYLVNSLNYLAHCYEKTGKFDEAIELFDEAIEVSQCIHDDIQYALILNKKGLAYWHYGYVNEAYELMILAGKASENIDNKTWKSAHKTNLGLILTDLSRFEEAISLFIQAHEGHNDLGYLHWVAVNYGSWGRALMLNENKSDIHKAIEYIRKAEKLSRAIYYPENLAFHIGDLGKAFFILADYEQSYQYLNEAVQLETRIGATHDLRFFNHLVNLAQVCFQLNKKDKLWEALIMSDSLAKNLNISSNHPIKRVRENVHSLNELKTRIMDQSNPSEFQAPSSIGKSHLGKERINVIYKQARASFDKEIIKYPWLGLEECLQEKGEKTLKLFGYGSLINKKSALKTIQPASEHGFLPALGFGMLRVLDYDMPDEVKTRSAYQESSKSNNRGLFNVRFTRFMSDAINGVYFEINIEEIDSLRKREIGYNLKPIICSDWNNPESILPAYALGCEGELWNGKPLTNDKILPHLNYYEICKEGALGISKDFLLYFQETSLLADGFMTVSDWEKKINEY